jgi:hypothetical protein
MRGVERPFYGGSSFMQHALDGRDVSPIAENAIGQIGFESRQRGLDENGSFRKS